MKKLFILLASAAVFGFNQNSQLSTLPDNTVKDLGLYSSQCPDSSFDPNDCRRYGDYSRFTYDSDRHRLLFFGGGHSTTMRDDVDNFNFATLLWKSDQASTKCSQMTSVTTNGTWSSSGHPVARHTYDQLIYAPSVQKLIITSPVYGAGYCGTFGGCGEWCVGKMLSYNPDTKTWTPKATGTNGAHVWSSEYDPVSGRIISAGGGGLKVYDPVNDVQTTPLSSSPISGYADNFVYYPPTDKFYYIARGGTTQMYEVTLNRSNWSASTITAVSGATGAPSTQESGWAYDSVNQVIGGGIQNGVIYLYNPKTKAWSSMTMQAQSGSGSTAYSHCVEYDPVDNVFIYMGTDFHMHAYRYKKGTGTGEESAYGGQGQTAEGKGNVSISPNPVRGKAVFSMTGTQVNPELAIYNLKGALVARLSKGAKGFQWDPRNLPAGTYVAKLAGTSGEISKRLVYLP